MDKPHPALELKGYLLGRICPVFVIDPGEECQMRPRLWGRLTFPLVAWYCGLALNDFPIVYRTKQIG